MKASSSTHWVYGSQTTGHRSSIPNRSRTSARSASVVTGVMRSTMELGKRTSRSTQSPSSGSRSRAKVVNTRLVSWPLSCRLSQDMTVNGATPCFRRRHSASVIRPNVVRGTASGSRSWITSGLATSNSPVTSLMLYPPSVTVSDTIRVDAAAIFSMTASGSSGANRYSTIDPITRGSYVPSLCLSTSV